MVSVVLGPQSADDDDTYLSEKIRPVAAGCSNIFRPGEPRKAQETPQKSRGARA